MDTSLTDIEFAFSAICRALDKKDITFFFSEAPAELFTNIVKELEVENNQDMESIIMNHVLLENKFIQLVREIKQNNQLILLTVVRSKMTLQEHIIEQINKEFPGAFSKRFKRTKRKYGAVQAKIEFKESRGDSDNGFC